MVLNQWDSPKERGPLCASYPLLTLRYTQVRDMYTLRYTQVREMYTLRYLLWYTRGYGRYTLWYTRGYGRYTRVYTTLCTPGMHTLYTPPYVHPGYTILCTLLHWVSALHRPRCRRGALGSRWEKPLRRGPPASLRTRECERRAGASAQSYYALPSVIG